VTNKKMILRQYDLGSIHSFRRAHTLRQPTAAPQPDRPGRISAILGSIALATLITAGAAAPSAAQGKPAPDIIHRIASLPVPGNPLKVFDGSVVDGNIYALADRSNSGVDLFDARTGKFLGRAGGFVGFNRKSGPNSAGPNGMTAVGPRQIWAGDGNSTVKIVDIRTHRVIGTIPTGGSHRADELAYDAHDHLVVAANNADSPPFVSFISTQGNHRVVGRLSLPQATHGLEQPVWDRQNDRIYMSIPQLNGQPAEGGIAVIDPHSRKLLAMIPVSKCLPGGLAAGPHRHLLVGCSDDAVAAGFPAKSLIVDAASGKVVRSIHQVGGSDEVWYAPRQGRFYLSAVANPGGPVLGVIDARDDRWLANLPTGPHAHSVAAGGADGHVFVPIAANQEQASCHDGCIAVFAAPHRSKTAGTTTSSPGR
jgi:DNA-binding beta-propeller fold protein YncE